MSRANITAMVSTVAGLFVVFALRDGGARIYRYEGLEAAAILAGADPADYSGEQAGPEEMAAALAVSMEGL